MRGFVSTCLSIILFAFLALFGAFNYSKPIFCKATDFLSESELESCVYELYLYHNSSGCEIIGFDAQNLKGVRAEKLKRGKDVKGERLFIPFEKTNFISLNENKTIKAAKAICDELRAKKVYFESGEDFYNEYYYCDGIKNFSIVNGEKVNFQISYTSAGISFASPVAFGAY